MATINLLLPCDINGICMVCKETPLEEEKILCKTCGTPWHINCLFFEPPEPKSNNLSLAEALEWECPDCSNNDSPNSVLSAGSQLTTSSDHKSWMMTAIREIESDQSLTELERAEKRQQLVSGVKLSKGYPLANAQGNSDGESSNDAGDMFNGQLICTICNEIPQKPISIICGHNFCLKCFRKWTAEHNTCANCRTKIPPLIKKQPKINNALNRVLQIASKSNMSFNDSDTSKVSPESDEKRLDKTSTKERAKKTAVLDGTSEEMLVTVPNDHFGPILPVHDPIRNQGVLVGESWPHRKIVSQWGLHPPMVASIHGHENCGAQSVVLSGGHEDDEDHGEWVLYSGCGKDLSGNRPTGKRGEKDQEFNRKNQALRVSCLKGYPVRVIRSYKQKGSAYAPSTGYRYDGIYRIEKCWRKFASEGFLRCRYLMVRCDNEPVPWISFDQGNQPLPSPVIEELNDARDVTERTKPPAWDYDEIEGRWMWKISPPSTESGAEDAGDSTTKKRKRKKKMEGKAKAYADKILEELRCQICRNVMNLPVTTPCGHNFCQNCLHGVYAGKAQMRERTSAGKTLRAKKNVMRCPTCPTDISDDLQNLQVNRDLTGVIETLKHGE